MCPFLALPVWPGGRITSRWMLVRIPSFSESESAMVNDQSWSVCSALIMGRSRVELFNCTDGHFALHVVSENLQVERKREPKVQPAARSKLFTNLAAMRISLTEKSLQSQHLNLGQLGGSVNATSVLCRPPRLELHDFFLSKPEFLKISVYARILKSRSQNDL